MILKIFLKKKELTNFNQGITARDMLEETCSMSSVLEKISCEAASSTAR